MTQVYAMKLDEELSDPLFRVLSGKIAPDKKEKIGKFFRKEDAIRSLFSDILIRYILVNKFRVGGEDLLFHYSVYGKPSLIRFDAIHFNTSHSGSWVVCVTDSRPVGIDVEKIVPVDMDIAGYYFSEEERQELFALPPSARRSFFFELWTLKESFIKQQGKGLSIPLNSFTVVPGKKQVVLSREGTAAAYHFRQYEIDPHYKMAVCALSDDFGAIEIIAMQDILVSFQALP